MVINMSEILFNELIRLCKNSKRELSGTMKVKVSGEDIYIVGINLDSPDFIVSSNSNEVVFDTEKYITKAVYDLTFTEDLVYIRFHTHPLFSGVAGLSKTDVSTLKYMQGLASRVSNLKTNDYVTVIEGIITNSEIAFYTYDLEANKVRRFQFLVDGCEKIPATEKRGFQIFKDGFLAGIKKSKKIN